MLAKQTQKRIWLMITLLIMLAIQINAEAQTLKIATVAPDGTTWMQEMRTGGEEIEKKTDGRVKLKFYPGGVMGSDKSVLGKIRIGQLHGGAITGGSSASIFSDAQIYSLPFQFQNTEQVSHVRNQMDEILKNEFEKNGFVNLGISDGGFAYLFSKKPVRSIKDLKGQRVWIPEGDIIGETVFAAAGIKPVSLPISDVFTALQTGLIDVVVVNLTGAIAFQWYTKLQYITDIPLLFLTGMMVVDSKAFKRLTDEDRKIVREVMQSKFKILDILNRKDNESARVALQKEGMEFINLTIEERGSWHKIADTALEELGEKGAYTEPFYKMLQSHLKTYHSNQTAP